MTLNSATIQMTTWRPITPRPLSCVNTVMRDLDISSPKVMELIEEGRLTAFNIATDPSTRCAQMRILTKSVEHCLTMGWQKPLLLDWPQILTFLMPHGRPSLRRDEIERCLNTSRIHIWKLIKKGLFAPFERSSVSYTRESFEKFLKERMQ
jgi:hypothetical protein